MTLDYGLRIEHHGAIYEARDENSGFDPALWSAAERADSLSAGLSGSARGNAARPPTSGAIDPRFPDRVPQPRAPSAASCRASARSRTGSGPNGLNSHPTQPGHGKKDGWYYDLPMWSYAPRVGIAWDVFGDGKTAIRASTGRVLQLREPQSCTGSAAARSSAARGRSATRRSTTWHAVAAAGTFVESPQGTRIPDGFPLSAPRQPDCAGRARAGTQLPRQPRVPARHRLQHRRRSRVRLEHRAEVLAQQDRRTTSRSTPTRTRTTCSTAKRSTRTSCGATSRASAASATWRPTTTSSTTTRCS